MLNSRVAFDNIIRHFPKWMNIRKRKHKSYGGNYLYAIAKELDDIQREIENYKKDFFIINYIGKEDSVIDYLYVAEVGELDSFILLHPFNHVTYDIKEFYHSKDKVALYYEGRILIKPKDAGGEESIKYSKNGFAYSAKLKKVHIWNVIDEFALFAGLKRLENETNKELLERTLLVFRNKANSTENGLKNAIMNAVSNYTSVSPGEIKIEKPSETNLFKETESQKIVIEELAELNKDLYRTKKWDESRWEHPFKTMDYVGHKWDAELEAIQDGTGHNDALKASLLSELGDKEKTNVKIDLYEKSDVRINEYIRNNRVEADIDLELKKYKNKLKPKSVEYKIVAEETDDITDSGIHIDCYRLTKGENKYHVADLVLNQNDIKDITIERGKLNPNTKYKLQFRPLHEYSEMKIYKADLKHGNQTVSLLKEKGAFKLNEDGELVNTNVRLHATSTRDFKDHSNIRNVNNGFTLNDATKDGIAVIDVSKMGNQYVKIEAESRETNIVRNREIVQFDNDFIINESGEIESVGREGEIVIDLVCTQLYYEMLEGNCIVTKIIDGEPFPSEIWYDRKSEHLKFDEAKHVKVIIRKLSNDKKLIIGDIRYARFDIELKLEKGEFIRTPLGMVLPNIENNSLIVTFRTYTGFSPVIKFVHIGASLKNAVYETDIFESKDLSYLEIESNCIAKLIEIGEDGKAKSEIDRFISKNYYKNTRTSPVYLEIDTSGFEDIKRTAPELERFSYQGKMSSWIRLDPGEEIDEIFIEGNVRNLIKRIQLDELLKEKEDDKIYISKNLKGFILKNKNREKLIHLKREDIHPGADVYVINNLPYGVRSVFVIDKNNNIESITNTHLESFEEIYLLPKSTQQYIAYNRTKMVRPEMSQIKMVDLFTPMLPKNRLMVYTIEPLEKEGLNASVLFEKEEKKHEYWSLGKKDIRIELEIDQHIPENYETESIQFNKKFVLNNYIDIEQEMIANGKIIDTAEYMIRVPEGMRIIYEAKTAPPEVFYVEEDGFNKLRYANIKKILSIKNESGQEIDESHYQLLSEEGIVAWTNQELFGEKVIVEYEYNAPKYITFVDVEKLYELAGYNVQAYKYMTSIYYESISEDMELSENDLKLIQASDRAIVYSSNPNFRARIDHGIIRLTKVNEEDYIVVKPGFLYQDGLEQYFYANRNENLLERFNNIELINTSRIGNGIHFYKQSRNFLPESSMKPKRMGETSFVDFVNNERISGISRMDALTACDSINHWNTFEMDVTFKEGLNGLGLSFEALRSESYATLDITKYLTDNTIISFYTKGNIKAYIAKERKHQGYSFNKSVFVEPVYEFKTQKDYMFFVFDDKTFEKDYQYHLLIKGSGIVDDIIIKNYQKNEDIESIHRKNIDAIGLDIEEHAIKNHIQKLLFDRNWNYLNRVEIDEKGIIKTGMNVDWGFTKIKEYKNNWADCYLNEVDLIKESFLRTTNRVGIVETGVIHVRNRNSLRSLIVKINEVLLNETSGFKIEVYTSEAPNRNFSLAATQDAGNVLIVPGRKVNNYVKIRIEAPPYKVINNLEVYSEYMETEKPLRIGEYANGELVTKVFDSGFEKHYQLKQIHASYVHTPEAIEIEARAFRYKDDRLVWTDWKKIEMDEKMNILFPVEFEGYRYFQFKIILKNKEAEIKLDSIDLEVIG